jgi:hypothetical protein
LDAAHIKPYAELGRHRLENGILLRNDLHALFDAGYVTVTPSLELRVSRRIREEFENGRDYYALESSPVRATLAPAPPPSVEFLEWHGDTVFRRLVRPGRSSPTRQALDTRRFRLLASRRLIGMQYPRLMNNGVRYGTHWDSASHPCSRPPDRGLSGHKAESSACHSVRGIRSTTALLTATPARTPRARAPPSRATPSTDAAGPSAIEAVRAAPAAELDPQSNPQCQRPTR